MPIENPQPSLTELHREAIAAANSSWSETDKLYVSVCSALVALAAIFGSGMQITLVGVLLLLLTINWIRLIGRYRAKVFKSLSTLSNLQAEPETRDYFANEQKHFKRDLGDYAIAVAVLLMSLLLIAAGVTNSASA